MLESAAAAWQAMALPAVLLLAKDFHMDLVTPYALTQVHYICPESMSY